LPDGVVILGAGLAGLSAAFHLRKGFEVFEAGDVPGGLCATLGIGGYLFDYTGHLLHLKDTYARDMVKGFLAGNLKEHKRNAAIYTQGVFTGYPYQANTYGLPAETARECVDGFLNASGRTSGGPQPENFRDWVTYNFGDGIARNFMLPYNGKLWQYPLEDMAVDGIMPYVPVPQAEEVIKGSSREGAMGLGYNASFYYPVDGGIRSLVDAFVRHVKAVSYGQRAVEIDAERKTVVFGTGYTAWYDSLISTMPLPELIRIIKDVPREIAEAAGKLRYVSVYDINLGIARDGISPYHWVYFPEPEFMFYRLGFLTNFSGSMAPEGKTAVYAEVSHKPSELIGKDELVEGTLGGMRLCGMLDGGETAEVSDVQDMKYAYVVFDAHYKKTVPAIMDFLRSKGIMSIGRYGAWEYSSMEDAILEGKLAVERLQKAGY
jgi:protoporphyrinogen oxidase